jgi:hypothetical protein
VLKNLKDCGPGVVKPNDSKGLVGTSRTLTSPKGKRKWSRAKSKKHFKVIVGPKAGLGVVKPNESKRPTRILTQVLSCIGASTSVGSMGVLTSKVSVIPKSFGDLGNAISEAIRLKEPNEAIPSGKGVSVVDTFPTIPTVRSTGVSSDRGGETH